MLKTRKDVAVLQTRKASKSISKLLIDFIISAEKEKEYDFISRKIIFKTDHSEFFCWVWIYIIPVNAEFDHYLGISFSKYFLKDVEPIKTLAFKFERTIRRSMRKLKGYENREKYKKSYKRTMRDRIEKWRCKCQNQ